MKGVIGNRQENRSRESFHLFERREGNGGRAKWRCPFLSATMIATVEKQVSGAY